MATTRAEITTWYDKGVRDGKAFMAVWCDTFDWDDYPVYYDTEEAAQKAIDNPSSMQRVMEVYDLKGNSNAPDDQIDSHRSWALKPKYG